MAIFQGNIGFIGCGNMAGAILGSLLRSGEIAADRLTIYDVDRQKCAPYAQKGIHIVESIEEIASTCDMIFLCVKPQVYPEVLSILRGKVRPAQLLISIAAGISTAYIKKALGICAKVVRVMPNTPMLLGAGAIALCRVEPVSEVEFEQVAAIFALSGQTAVIEEAQMDAIISVNGSSPAYVYLFAKAVADCAGEQGIDEQVALKLFCQTLIGAAKMMLASGQTPDELIDMVSSPGGTTLAALDSLSRNGFTRCVREAMLACTKRAEELGK